MRIKEKLLSSYGCSMPTRTFPFHLVTMGGCDCLPSMNRWGPHILSVCWCGFTDPRTCLGLGIRFLSKAGGGTRTLVWVMSHGLSQLPYHRTIIRSGYHTPAKCRSLPAVTTLSSASRSRRPIGDHAERANHPRPRVGWSCGIIVACRNTSLGERGADPLGADRPFAHSHLRTNRV